MRVIPIIQKRIDCRSVLRVSSLESLASEWHPGTGFAVRVNSSSELCRLLDVVGGGIGNLVALTSDAAVFAEVETAGVLDTGGTLEDGDVLGLTPGLMSARILFRAADTHHTVFLTNRCNSNCLMCSQPPTRHDDSWLVDEAIAVASHIGAKPKTIGFTGGEPLLLGGQLRIVLDSFRSWHPSARLEVLTNGRRFSEPALAHELLAGLDQRVAWMVPLYGHADFLHDFVVQSEGAFDQTIDGLLTLRSYRQAVQLRTVLIEPVLRVLPEFCDFIGRNLPFVQEVALMGCEPTGFAMANRDVCQVDLSEWGPQLVEAVRRLRRAGMRTALMNAPLCSLPEELWPHSHQSISDWKRVFAKACDACSMRDDCCGLFAWYEKGWAPTFLKPIERELAHEAL
jgi:His-Xaa-Ser system radical SAM maturase HxsC